MSLLKTKLDILLFVCLSPFCVSTHLDLFSFSQVYPASWQHLSDANTHLQKHQPAITFNHNITLFSINVIYHLQCVSLVLHAALWILYKNSIYVASLQLHKHRNSLQWKCLPRNSVTSLFDRMLDKRCRLFTSRRKNLTWLRAASSKLLSHHVGCFTVCVQ